MDWDPAVTAALERLTVFQRERLRERLAARAAADGRDRVTAADLDAERSGGGMAARRAAERPLEPVSWPPLAGRYRVLDAGAPVAVCTLASEDLPAALGAAPGLAIAGSAFTENLGVERVVANVVANPAIRVLLLCGTESRHRVGQTLRALHAHGVDADGRVVGSEGPLPLLRSTAPGVLEAFRGEIAIVDRTGEHDPDTLRSAIAAAAAGHTPRPAAPGVAPPETVAEAIAPRADRAEDEAGFFLVAIGPAGDRVMLDHYDREARLVARLSGRTAEALCRAAIARGLTTSPAHLAYLGRETARAEAAMRLGIGYEQDRPFVR